MPPPEDKKSVERLLGVINYIGKFIPDMSTITHPIWELLKKEVQFTWQWEQTKVFQKVKDVLSAAPALAFFNVTRPVVVSCDASQHGLGGCPVTRWKTCSICFEGSHKCRNVICTNWKEATSCCTCCGKFSPIHIMVQHLTLLRAMLRYCTCASVLQEMLFVSATPRMWQGKGLFL